MKGHTYGRCTRCGYEGELYNGLCVPHQRQRLTGTSPRPRPDIDPFFVPGKHADRRGYFRPPRR